MLPLRGIFMKLTLQTEDTPVIRKTKELCQTILEQPSYQELRQAIEAFLGDNASVDQYQRLCDLQEELGHKQSHGESLTNEEVEAFEKEERDFLANPAARPFIQAQRKLHEIETTISTYVRKTFELGRIPQESDFAGGCGCGSGGCGCH